MIYIYGGGGLAWKQQHRSAALRDGVLSFEDDQGSKFKFTLGAPLGRAESIDGTFLGASGQLTGTFQKLQ